MTSLSAYINLISKVVLPPKAILKWNEVFEITADEWNLIFKIPFITLSDCKIIYFQFRFLHRVVGTGKLLYLMKKRESPLCFFCKTEVENLDHLFWSCPFISTFLLDTEQYLFGRQFILSKRDFFSDII